MKTMSEFIKPCSDVNCPYNSLADCIECVKNNESRCAIWPVVKNMLERLEALENSE